MRLRSTFRDPRAAVASAALLVPVLLLAWMGWRHRWTADDGFIDLRVVRQIREGHGPVYNTGSRVETATSPLWVGLLALLDLLTPLRLEWIAVFAALGATLGGLACAIFGTRHALLTAGAPTATLIPLGALVYAAVPPAWDFSTSGLENGIGLLWLGGSWWLLTRRLSLDRADPSRPWWLPVLLGVGPLIRPDFAIFSVFFVAGLLILGEPRWKRALVAVGLALALPVVTELLRMAYYGAVVPNTAVAKEASQSNWHQGWLYLRDFSSPYLLLVPVLVLASVFGAAIVRRGGDGHPSFRVLGVVAVGAAAVHAAYVVRVGGDFMHGRMLLASFFVLLLPVEVVAVRGWQWAAAAVVVVWAMACAVTLRPPYSEPSPRATQGPGSVSNFAYGLRALDQTTGIDDERAFYTRFAGKTNPVTIDDYLEQAYWAQTGARTRQLEHSGGRGLLVDAFTDDRRQSLIPLRHDVPASLVASVPTFGLFGYAAGDDVYVTDQYGLADPVTAHQRITVRRRPGHEKHLPEAWLLALFADPDAPLPSTVRAGDVAAARNALRCGDLRELVASTRGALDGERVSRNLRHAFALWQFRFPGDPVAAEREVCRR